jgi:hypothetical protein
MKIWSVIFHHKHGISHFNIASAQCPSHDDVTAFLASEDGYEPGQEDEYFDIELAEIVSAKQFKDIVKQSQPEFANGARVWWTDPDQRISSGWYTIVSHDGEVYQMINKAGGECEAPEHELSEHAPKKGKK